MALSDNPMERARLLQHVTGRGRKPVRPHTQAAGGYGRISKSSKTKLETQRAYVAEMIAGVVKQPWRNEDGYDWFEDDGRTGLRATNRPGYQALLTAVESGRVSDVVFFKLDRMSRDDLEMKGQVERWLNRGVRVWDSRLGQITHDNVGILALLANMEVRATSQRVTAKLRKLAQEGCKLGGAPVGYAPVMRTIMEEGMAKTVRVPGTYVPDRHAGPVVAEVLRMVADPTQSLNGARLYLNRTLGTGYDHQSFKKLLRNPFYKGVVVNFRENVSLLLEDPEARDESEWEVTEHVHPLCDTATWDAIQHRLARGQVCHRNPLNPANAFSGLLHCGRCDRRLRPTHPHTGLTAYTCTVCSMVRAESTVKKALLAVLQSTLGSPEHTVVVAGESAQAAQQNLEQLQANLDARLVADKERMKEISRARAQLTIAQAKGVYSLADYDAAIALLADEAEEIRERTHANEAALTNLRRGTDLGAVVPLMTALRDWAATPCRRSEDDPTQTMEATKTRLQYLFDRLVLDPQGETFVATWAPDVAVLLGQQETVVPCKARRARAPRKG